MREELARSLLFCVQGDVFGGHFSDFDSFFSMVIMYWFVHIYALVLSFYFALTLYEGLCSIYVLY
jgi:hypothetical protein